MPLSAGQQTTRLQGKWMHLHLLSVDLMLTGQRRQLVLVITQELSEKSGTGGAGTRIVPTKLEKWQSGIATQTYKRHKLKRAPGPQSATMPMLQEYATFHEERMAAARPDEMRAPPYRQPLPMPQAGMPYEDYPEQ